MSSDRETQILDFAERAMRKGGLDSVSFRDVAAAIGIKSASVHYHFPTKADLAERVTQRYAERFIAGLGAPDLPDETPAARLNRLADAYQTAYALEESTCLCMVLGSVAANIPGATSNQVRHFYDQLGQWIAAALKGSATPVSPALVIATLQGAMALAVATCDPTPLGDARDHLVSTV
ncbi:TetR/AcrR family transcriptional regulator [uncultured Tateyamaria sp.]|uniref:TetR/AcrR family transcriptional regulator n=1 Tax=uncultured Tateyamaria sp. TaxID=455651 RepID=UPI0026149805|nr:TetR/AcrR family transcriptional regulator [uncultured Tateyamaria sp.]